ncbi:MAG TPA: hypothetical protein VG937_29690 [Polyangiaceae bacterium]|nr:hypothetical protein [Polyangiaceae bacterium]
MTVRRKGCVALLAKLYVAQPGARIGGSFQTLLQASDGFTLEIHPDVQAVLASNGDEMQWIPFAACRNGVLMPLNDESEDAGCSRPPSTRRAVSTG